MPAEFACACVGTRYLWSRIPLGRRQRRAEHDVECQFLLPAFQFDPMDMAVRCGVRDVIDTLVPLFDDWELASWFARPSEWLDGRRPADAVVRDPAAVLSAARTDRFVIDG